jgi:23S rRNA pseudouridine1911/1915/1917 synthase
VFINAKRVTKPSHKIRLGDVVSIELDLRESVLSVSPVPGDLSIIFEDSELLVLNKAQGIVVHPASGHRGDTLVNHLLHHLKQDPSFSSTDSVRPGIVHRLDKGTSGVMIVAKNRKTQDDLSKQFKERQIKKQYECVVWGQIKRPGALKSALGRDRIHRQKMSSKTSAPRQAETHFQPIDVFSHFTYLAVSPLTGRTHQIRVHLSEFGHSIVGDSLYGKGFTPKRLEALNKELAHHVSEGHMTFLHAKSISFVHPRTKDSLFFEAPLPPNFITLLNNLRQWDSL